MLSSGSRLVSADNTGIKRFKIIKILGSSFKKYAFLGDIVKVIIVKRKYNKKIIKKKIYFCIIITLKHFTYRKNGHYINFGRNKALTLSESLKFLGTRVYGPISKEAKKKNMKRIISYSRGSV